MTQKKKHTKPSTEEALLKKLEAKHKKLIKSTVKRKILFSTLSFSVIVIVIVFLYSYISAAIEKQSYEELDKDVRSATEMLHDQVAPALLSKDIDAKKGCWRPKFKYGEGQPTCRVTYDFDSEVHSRAELVSRTEKFKHAINAHGAFREGDDKNLYNPPLLTTDESRGVYVYFFVHKASSTGCTLWNIADNEGRSYPSNLSTSLVCSGKAKKLYF